MKVSEGFYSAADGLQLYFCEHGPPAGPDDAPPVLCLHGLTRNSRDFDELVALLSPRHRLITTDLRGRGHSAYDSDLRHYHPARYVDDVWHLLAHLGIGRVRVIGTSLGGLMAMLMAAQRPETLEAVVLNDVGPELDARGLARVAESAGRLPPVDDWAAAAAAVREATRVAFPDWPDERWMTFARKMYAPSAGGGLDVRLDRNVGEAMRRGFSAMREDPWELFGALRGIPLLVVHGEESDLLTPEILARMREARPDLRTVTVPRRGHAPNLDEAEAIDAIEKFLAAH
jgi:pimeloyl-ACP methyl ester carboxylesterase